MEKPYGSNVMSVDCQASGNKFKIFAQPDLLGCDAYRWLPLWIEYLDVMIRQNPCLLFSFLVNHILSWTPCGTMCLPRGIIQIALLSIGIYFFFLAFLVSDRRNRLPHVTIGLRP